MSVPAAPYAEPARQRLYHGLFADDALPTAPPDAPEWMQLLSRADADAHTLRTLAADPATEARVALRAWRRLHQQGHPVPARMLLGVVIEVPLPGGQDTLAAYRDGSVRFLHHGGHTSVVDGPVGPTGDSVRRLLQASQAVVDRIGPADRPRGAPPVRNVRLNFLVSDGLYFGEGPMETLMADGLAGPVLQAAVALLDQVTSLAAA